MAGQLESGVADQLQAHLATCPSCQAEKDQLLRLQAVLAKDSIITEPRAGFDQRVWNKIRAAEAEQPVAVEWWQRPAWILSLATSLALWLVATTANLAHQQNQTRAQQQLYAAIGLDNFDNAPAGSLASSYLHVP